MKLYKHEPTDSLILDLENGSYYCAYLSMVSSWAKDDFSDWVDQMITEGAISSVEGMREELFVKTEWVELPLDR